uniref:Uncharacterized protein n=1 Tax=Anguilla anguilla TaxID=7936 RepID=A0A0E9PII6_ANGAN
MAMPFLQKRTQVQDLLFMKTNKKMYFQFM